MVTQVEEITCTQELVAESARQLEREGIPAADSIPLGVMIETPAAAILVDQFANRCDFMSIGTNDLTQYTLALDRGNARLADRFTPHNPAVLQLLERIADGAARSGVEVSVCGEMASDPLSTFLLLGLGYRVLSVSPPSLPLVRWVIRQVDIDGAAAAANAALLAPTRDEADAILERGLAEFVDLELVKGGRLPTIVGSARLRSFSTGRL
jgi:phosphotransferase system enzyme I (PtsI)